MDINHLHLPVFGSEIQGSEASIQVVANFESGDAIECNINLKVPLMPEPQPSDRSMLSMPRALV